MSSTPKRFHFDKLPYDIRAIVYNQLSRKDIINLFSTSRRLNNLAGDVNDLYKYWFVANKNNSIDFNFHFNALSSPRWRHNLRHLHIGYSILKTGLKSWNIPMVLPKLAFNVSKMTNLRKLGLILLFNQSELSPESLKIQPLNVFGFVDTQLIDYFLPNDNVEFLFLSLWSSQMIRPRILQYNELLDRYPKLKTLKVCFEAENADYDELIEAYLSTLPLERILIFYKGIRYDPSAADTVYDIGASSKLEKVTGKDMKREITRQTNA